jgi:hypothetical protein
MQKRNTLNKRQQLFCQYLIEGESQAQSYLKAGFKANTIQQAGSNAIRLMRTERVSSYLSKLKDIHFTKQALSFAEKRAFLARAVRADASKADPDLVQEVREEVDQQGNVKRVVKLVNKLDALREDNAMSGDRFSDRSPQVSNPFLFLVTAFKQGDALHQGQRVQLPAPGPATISIDAEIVE